MVKIKVDNWGKRRENRIPGLWVRRIFKVLWFSLICMGGRMWNDKTGCSSEVPGQTAEDPNS